LEAIAEAYRRLKLKIDRHGLLLCVADDVSLTALALLTEDLLCQRGLKKIRFVHQSECILMYAGRTTALTVCVGQNSAKIRPWFAEDPDFELRPPYVVPVGGADVVKRLMELEPNLASEEEAEELLCSQPAIVVNADPETSAAKAGELLFEAGLAKKVFYAAQEVVSFPKIQSLLGNVLIFGTGCNIQGLSDRLQAELFRCNEGGNKILIHMHTTDGDRATLVGGCCLTDFYPGLVERTGMTREMFEENAKTIEEIPRVLTFLNN
jgi:hypothetical protein